MTMYLVNKYGEFQGEHMEIYSYLYIYIDDQHFPHGDVRMQVSCYSKCIANVKAPHWAPTPSWAPKT